MLGPEFLNYRWLILLSVGHRNRKILVVGWLVGRVAMLAHQIIRVTFGPFVVAAPQHLPMSSR
jgi:hypothetical protein